MSEIHEPGGRGNLGPDERAAIRYWSATIDLHHGAIVLEDGIMEGYLAKHEPAIAAAVEAKGPEVTSSDVQSIGRPVRIPASVFLSKPDTLDQ